MCACDCIHIWKQREKKKFLIKLRILYICVLRCAWMYIYMHICVSFKKECLSVNSTASINCLGKHKNKVSMHNVLPG